MAKPYAVVNEVQSDIATGNTWTRGTDTSIVLTDGSDFDDGGGYIRIGDQTSFALMEYTGRTTNTLTGLVVCTLGVVVSSGDETKEWPAGTEVSRVWMAEDGDDLVTFPQGIRSCRVRAYAAGALSIKKTTWVRVPFDTESFDAGGDFNVTGASGAADATEANKLHDADGGFTAALVGACVHNTTDDTYAIVSAYVDSGELTLSANIMANGENYVIYPACFTAPENGYYSVRLGVAIGPSADSGTDLHVVATRYRSGSAVDIIYAFVTGANAGGYIGWPVADLVYLESGDLLWVSVYHTSSSSVALANNSKYSFLSISLESRP